MSKFFFKSAPADLQKFVLSLDAKLDMIVSNVNYSSYRIDRILKLISSQIPTQAVEEYHDMKAEDYDKEVEHE